MNIFLKLDLSKFISFISQDCQTDSINIPLFQKVFFVAMTLGNMRCGWVVIMNIIFDALVYLAVLFQFYSILDAVVFLSMHHFKVDGFSIVPGFACVETPTKIHIFLLVTLSFTLEFSRKWSDIVF